MPVNKYKRLRVRGVTFVFKYEEDHPDILHIYARHLKSPDDAIHIFFHGIHSWNEEHSRWEAVLENEALYWFWRDEEEQIVMVISCFDQ